MGCTNPVNSNATDCLGSLAGGWITVPDLCPSCTRELMAAVDWVTNRQNVWHPNYLKRAAALAIGAHR